MKDKISNILRVVGSLMVLGAVAYHLLTDNPNESVYWSVMAVGIVIVLLARLVNAVHNNDDYDE